MDGECWRSDAEVSTWAAGAGHAWKERLAGAFSARVTAIAHELGRTPLMWDEALELGNFLGKSPKSDGPRLTISVWRDWLSKGDAPGGEAWRRAVAAGHDVVWNALGWYLDLPQNTWQSMYQLRMPGDGGEEVPAAFLGGEASSWSETADEHNLQPRVLTRAAAAAERLWSGPPSRLEHARARLTAMRCRLVRRGLHAEPVVPDHCSSAALPAASLGTPSPRVPTVGETSLEPDRAEHVSAPGGAWASSGGASKFALRAPVPLALFLGVGLNLLLLALCARAIVIWRPGLARAPWRARPRGAEKRD